MYDDEKRLSVFAFVFSLVIILISAMGLFGLASYTTERRTREIGIRKVFGASEESIVAMLTMDFLKLVLVSSVLAWPVAYIIVTSWLKNFAYAASLSIVPFVLAVVGAVVVAWLTVSLKAIRAAISNPIDALRYE
jgi:putative ABC transport system permease protein